jgi:hypothetical protein
VAITFFVLGILLMIASALLRRHDIAAFVLATGAVVVVAVALVGILYLDPRIGEAAVRANRGQYEFIVACQLPVLILALASRRGSRGAFWLGWGTNLAFSLFVVVVVVWLKFYWHW